MRWCTKPDCEGFGRAPGNWAKAVECEKCGNRMCFECRETEHTGRTCEENTEQMYSKIFKGTNINIAFCPKCKTKVEKSSGCNHMTCYICKFQWCWICGKTYSQYHFMEGKC